MTSMYKVVEMQPTDNGRLQRVGPVWQPTLERARQMAHDIARQSLAARIFIEDVNGQTVETIRGYRDAIGPVAGPAAVEVDDPFAAQNWGAGF